MPLTSLQVPNELRPIFIGLALPCCDRYTACDRASSFRQATESIR